jgi:hypothetical protein
VIDFTEPISTSLYLTWVLPGSRPSALLKTIVIAGPRSVTDLMTSAMPINAATSGITQTSEGSQLRRGAMSGSGRSGGRAGPCGLLMAGLRSVAGRGLAAVRRAYRIAPQAGKTFEIAPLTITVYPGGMTGPAQVRTPALKLTATLPPGAEGMTTFFAAPKLTVEQKIEPAPGHLAVGAPLTRTITQRAAGTESMLIPPAILADVAGLKRYAKPAATRNIVEDRAGLVAGERTDSASYVAVGSFVRRSERVVSQARNRWLASDALAWRKLAMAARKGEWRRTIPALYAWMDRGGDFGRPARFENIDATGDQDAASLIAAVESNYAGDDARRRPRWKEIGAVLRRSANRARTKRKDETLPGPLNRY